jgi:septal ring factor EnvC (AmiA/AmiB activator)
MAFDPRDKTRQELIAEIRRLEEVEATKDAAIASLTSQLNAKTAELAVANATITARTVERDAANQAALEEAMAHALTREERDVLHATVQGFVPMQAFIHSLRTTLQLAGPADVLLPIVEVP